MAAITDQSDAASSLGRSSSIDARDGALPRSDSQRRSANKAGRKAGRSGNDLFVCFAPRTTLNLVSANRPVVSPARDKGKDTGSARRSSRNLSASIFSNKNPSKKQDYDAVVEEPTSPKVTCIGQVRSKSKKDKKNRGSPAAPRKQGSAEGKKESACSNFAKDFSCFGLPCDSYGSLPSFRGDKKSNGTMFAKSLVLIQNEDEGKKMVAMEASVTAKLQVQNIPGYKSGGEVLASKAKPSLREEPSHPEISPNSPFLQDSLAVVGASSSKDKTEASTSKEAPEDQTSVDEDDTFETDPPPPNALLLMRNKVDHLRVLVPPPAINVTLKRSTSAPVHRRRKSEDGTESCHSHAPSEHADHSSLAESSVLISSEDLPKPSSNASKTFLQRCKSVSRSLSRSSSEHAEEPKPSSVITEMKAATEIKATSGHKVGEKSALDEHKEELQLVSEAMSRRRSDSEALKVSLDIVPETWLWEAGAAARQGRKETTGSGRRLEMKQGGGVVEWLDGELEAALWKSCHVADTVGQTRNEALTASLNGDTVMTANQGLDAEVEATLWRCCSLVASHSSQDLPTDAKSDDGVLNTVKLDPKPDGFTEGTLDPNEVQEGKIEEHAKGVSSTDKCAHASNLGRSASVGSQGGKHLLERGSSLRRSVSVGAGRLLSEQQERTRSERRKSTERTKEETIVEQSPIGEKHACACPLDEAHTGVVLSEGYTMTCIVEADSHLDKHEIHRDGIVINCQDFPEVVESMNKEEGMDANTSTLSPSLILERSVPPPSPAPVATPPEAVLYVRYDIGAFRISLDAPSAKMDGQGAIDHHHHHQQQKAMLEAISHLNIHDVQRTYTRLLKAASGKEKASLSSAAFRLQRCKSEPVRLASY